MSTDNYGYGRKIIYTDYDEITDDNICDSLIVLLYDSDIDAGSIINETY